MPRSLPHSPEGDYYLTAATTYLREAAAADSKGVEQLYQGDQVEKLEAGPAGWWQVRSGRTGQTGWVSADLFSHTPVPGAPAFGDPNRQFAGMSQDLPVSGTFPRGAQDQKLERNNQGWWRVLVIESRHLGWLPAKTLAENLDQSKAPGKSYFYVAVRP